MLTSILSLIAVGFLWGATNPFIRKGSNGIQNINTGSKIKNIILEIKLIGSRLGYWIPFLLNQLGSVLYVYTLQSASISVAVPIANSLSFAFTAVVGYLLGEKIPGKNVIIGTMLVTAGMSHPSIPQKIDKTELQKMQMAPILTAVNSFTSGFHIR
ncbi:transmembrane protein 234 homolog [Episyrphus balteatus]|uniref:transmembrane protein 234 homolog n=1 Tax=Episyrphus balteatus TaxID=286459 RepID=UPI002485CED3|nr:transmembrane protein 234 homolog [Episyrphus balteatus]XP_055854738.1 transmembrane protein 234 homolog [Episyrphus balteatus]